MDNGHTPPIRFRSHFWDMHTRVRVHTHTHTHTHTSYSYYRQI